MEGDSPATEAIVKRWIDIEFVLIVYLAQCGYIFPEPVLELCYDHQTLCTINYVAHFAP